jgi:hypothetical protein
MSVAAPHRLLWDALVLPLPQARDAWRSWRASTDLDRLDHDSFLLLPALAGRMADWLAHDPQQAILRGICRRAWSQNQLRLKLLTDALEILKSAGIDRVAAAGPVLWGTLYWPKGAIRPVGRVDLLVEPAAARSALEAFFKAAWRAPNSVPDITGKQLYFAPGTLLQPPSGGEVWVHWRALPNTDLALRRPPAPLLEAMQASQIAAYAPPLEHSLITALGGMHQDAINWHCDAFMICRQAGLPWEIVTALLRCRSRERNRLDELRRAWNADIPIAVTKPVWSNGLEQMLASTLRVYRRYQATRNSLP